MQEHLYGRVGPESAHELGLLLQAAELAYETVAQRAVRFAVHAQADKTRQAGPC